jgi:hypothetical protein
MPRFFAHRHLHKSGHDMLGARINQDGRHELEKHKDRSISVQTRHGKVVGMDDGVEHDCYWHPASDVDDPTDDWAPYDPTY